MGLFSAIRKIGTAVKDTVLLPVDVVKDVINMGDPNSQVDRRVTKIENELSGAYEETFEDES